MSRHRPVNSNDAGSRSTRDVMRAPDSTVSRGIEKTLDQFAHNEQWESFARLALEMTPIARYSMGLIERLARFHLREDRPDAAIALIESIVHRRGGMTSSMRLLYAVALIQADRCTEAHAVLREDTRAATARAGQMEILTLLTWELEGPTQASKILNRDQSVTPRGRLIEVLAAISQDLPGSHLRELMHGLAISSCDDTISSETSAFCSMLGEKPGSQARLVAVKQIAAELRESEEILQSIAEVVRHVGHPDRAGILAEAIEHGLNSFDDPPAAAMSAAKLYAMIGERERAIRLIDDVSARHPLSAVLKLVRDELSIQTDAKPDRGEEAA